MTTWISFAKYIWRLLSTTLSLNSGCLLSYLRLRRWPNSLTRLHNQQWLHTTHIIYTYRLYGLFKPVDLLLQQVQRASLATVPGEGCRTSRVDAVDPVLQLYLTRSLHHIQTYDDFRSTIIIFISSLLLVYVVIIFLGDYNFFLLLEASTYFYFTAQDVVIDGGGECRMRVEKSIWNGSLFLRKS